MRKWRGKVLLFKTFLSHTHRRKSSVSQGLMDSSERYSYNPTLSWNSEVEDYFVQAYGADHFSRISKALLRPSCYSCIRVNKLKSSFDAVVEKLSVALQVKRSEENSVGGTNTPDMSNNSATTSVNSTIVSSVSNGRYILSKCGIPNLDYVVFVKGSGPHTINYENKENTPYKEVVVSRKCAEAVLRGAQVYVPGVLACSAHVEKGETVAVSVALEQLGADGGWGVGFTRGTVLQGSDADPYHFDRSGLYIGQGTTSMSRAGLFRVLEGLAVDMKSRVFDLPSFHDMLEGEIFLQNLPSIVVAHALDPQEGEKIYDMCAAPGGKTTAIAILMKDKGEVIAADRSHNKLLDIQKLATEMDLKCIKTLRLDATRSVQQINGVTHQEAPCPVDIGITQTSNSSALQNEEIATSLDCNFTENLKIESCSSKLQHPRRVGKLRNGPGKSKSVGGRVEKSKGFPPNSFDRVLLDAPCSALGLRPRLFTGDETLESLRAHAKYQRRMFDQAVELVRPGGVIVYSTCTINPGENEALVRYALDRYKFLSLAPQHPKVAGPGLVGRFRFSDGYEEEWLRDGEENLVQRFDPSSELDTIGFFIAKFSVGCKDL